LSPPLEVLVAEGERRPVRGDGENPKALAWFVGQVMKATEGAIGRAYSDLLQ
jgi:Asp-tRNA(Asn)/Glu-tRNA(Gln) amidotransferase B subunit